MATKREILKGMGLTDEQIDEALSKMATLPQGQRPFGIKVSDKKCVSVYGIRTRFPLTFYASEWQDVLMHADEINTFIEENRDKLAWRSDRDES